MAKVIGLTGGFGTGKTFAASVFRSLGAKVIDADKLSRAAVARGRPAYKKLVGIFGPGILGGSCEIDRKKLAEIVFADKEALKRLNRAVHPEVIASIKKSVRSRGSYEVIVIDAPLLIEAGLERLADILVVVTAPRGAQIKRCIKKFKMERMDVIRRMGSQLPMKKKIKMADFIVDNGGQKTDTKEQIKRIWKEIVWR